jgi:hypothetical protein
LNEVESLDRLVVAGFDQAIDIADAGDDRCVVAASELVPDAGVGNTLDLSHQVHCDVPRNRDVTLTATAQKAFNGKPIILGDKTDDPDYVEIVGVDLL